MQKVILSALIGLCGCFLMVWNSKAGSDAPGTFFFVANDGATAGDVASAISTHYGVSVLLQGKMGSEPVRGRLIATNLSAALECLAFFVNARPRADATKEVYFFGGSTEKVLADMPTYGMPQNNLSGLFEGNAIAVGDRLLVNSDPVKLQQLREALAPLGRRKTIVLEVVMLDVSTNQFEYINGWLKQFQLGGGYGVAAGTMGGLALGEVLRGPQAMVDFQALFGFMPKDKHYKMELRQQSQVLSGSKTEFKSGEVQEDVTYTTLPNQTGGSAQLVSQIARRTIGLSLVLQGTYLGENPAGPGTSASPSLTASWIRAAPSSTPISAPKRFSIRTAARRCWRASTGSAS